MNVKSVKDETFPLWDKLTFSAHSRSAFVPFCRWTAGQVSEALLWPSNVMVYGTCFVNNSNECKKEKNGVGTEEMRQM